MFDTEMKSVMAIKNWDNAAAAGMCTGVILLTAAFLVPTGQVPLAAAGLLLLLPSLLYGAR